MRFKRFSAVLVFSLLSGVGLIQYLSYKDSHPSTEDAYVQAHIVNIASRVSGPVIKLHVSENDYVNTGDVLFEIDPSVFDHSVDSQHQLTVLEDGDYIVAATMPVISVDTADNRPSQGMEVYVNGEPAAGSMGQSGYIRNQPRNSLMQQETLI